MPMIFAAIEEPTPSLVLTKTLAPLDGVQQVYSTQGSRQCASLDASSIGHRFACWGANDYGVLGYDGGEEFVAHAAERIPAEATALAMGRDHSCVLLPPDPPADRPLYEVWCWGREDAAGDGTGASGAGPSEDGELSETA